MVLSSQISWWNTIFLIKSAWISHVWVAAPCSDNGSPSWVLRRSESDRSSVAPDGRSKIGGQGSCDACRGRHPGASWDLFWILIGNDGWILGKSWKWWFILGQSSPVLAELFRLVNCRNLTRFVDGLMHGDGPKLTKLHEITIWLGEPPFIHQLF